MIKLISSVAVVALVAGCAKTPSLPAADAPVAAYRCLDGTRFTAVFNEEEAVLRLEGGEIFTLAQRRVASGFRYASKGVELRGKGTEATFQTRRLPGTVCRAA